MRKPAGIHPVLCIFLAAGWGSLAVAQTASFSLSSTTVASGSAAVLDLTLSGSANPASLQWKITYPASSVSGFSITAGSALTAAQKTLQCAPASGSAMCVGSGLNTAGIGNGIVATITLTPVGSSSINVGISNAVAASSSGAAIATSASGGQVTVGSTTVVSALTCQASALTTPGSTSCTVSLSGAAPSGGASVALSSNNASLTVPSSVMVAAGASAASFTATAASVTSGQTATVSASLNGSSKTASITLSPAGAAPITVLHGTACGPQTWPGTCTIPATTAGSLLVVSYSSYSTAGTTPVMSSMKDNAGNAYQQVKGARSVNTQSGSGSWNDMWYAANTKGGTTNITVNPSTAETGDVYVWEISGASAVDAAAQLSTQAASATPAGAPITTSAGGIVLALLHPAPNGGPSGMYSGNPFLSDSTNDGMAWAHLVTTAAGTYVPQWRDAAAATFAATTVAFKMAAGATSTVTVSSLACQASTLATPGSTSCTVTLSGAAPSGGASVALSSNNASLTVPSSVMVAAGASAASFTATAASVTSGQTATVSASLNGSSKTASITLSPAGAAPITVLHGTACGPQTWPGTCTIPATTAGSLLVVSYSSYSTAGTTPVMSSMKDNAGNAYQQVKGARSVNTQSGSGSWNDMWYAANTKGGTTSIRVNPSTAETGDVYVWEISGANAVDAAAQLSTQAASATPAGAPITTSAGGIVLALLHPAPNGGPSGMYSGNPFLSDSTNDGMAWAHLVTTAAGTYVPQWSDAAAATFAATTVAFKMAAGATSTVTVSSLACQASTLATPGSTSCTVTLSGAAPSGGASVALSSNNASLTVPSSVMVAAGASAASFTATAASVTSGQTATVSASLNGSSKTASITLSPAGAAPITVLHGTACGPQTWPGTCTIPATTAGSLLVVSYSSYSTAGTTPVMSSMKDNAGNAYQQVKGARSVNTQSGSGSWNDMWYAANTKGGTTSIRVNPSTAETGDVYVWEISGANAVDAAAQLSTQAASATPAGAPITTSAGGIVLALLHPAPNGGPSGMYSGNPFLSDSTNDGMAWAHLVTTAAGTYVPQWSDAAAATFAATTVAFKMAAGATSTVTVSSLACQASTLATPGSTSCTVTLSGAAPSGGASVALSSNNASLTVPSSVMVAAGASAASFTATAASVTSGQTATVSASLNGSSKTASITLSPAGAAPITVLHGTACGPQTWPGTCTIPATTAGSLLVVSYSSYSTAGTTPVMSSMKDNAGNAYQQVKGARSVNTQSGSGSWNDMWYAANTKGGTTSIRVNPSTAETGDVYVWEISGANAVDAAAQLSTQAASATPAGAPITTSAGGIVLALLHPAPNGGPSGMYSGNPFLSDSTNDGMAWAHLVTTAAGTYVPQWSDAAAATFAATTVAFKMAAGATSTVTVSSLACQASTLATPGSTSCTVTLSGAAPSGGASVALSSNNASLTVPSSVMVAAGASAASFTATAASVTSGQTATVSASLNGSSKTASITLSPAGAAPITVLHGTACGPQTWPGTCTIPATTAGSLLVV